MVKPKVEGGEFSQKMTWHFTNMSAALPGKNERTWNPENYSLSIPQMKRNIICTKPSFLGSSHKISRGLPFKTFVFIFHSNGFFTLQCTYLAPDGEVSGRSSSQEVGGILRELDEISVKPYDENDWKFELLFFLIIFLKGFSWGDIGG